MKLVSQPRVELLYACTNLIISCEKADTKLLQRFLSNLGTLDLEKDYVVQITNKKRKRSLDANAYFWVLVGKLGEVLNKPDSEIYREIIRDNGVFQIVPIREDAIERWVSVWGHNGIGWVCDDLGECRTVKGYHNIKCYYGSSTYDSKEMARLIDAVVDECKNQGIETMTPNEIEELKQRWGA